MDEDPVRLVVKNTFIDVNDEGEAEATPGVKQRNNRRASDTGVNYSSRSGSLAQQPYSEEVAYGGGGGTFIDDMMHAPKGQPGPGSPKRVHVGSTFVDVTDDSDASLLDFGEELASNHRRGLRNHKPQKMRGQQERTPQHQAPARSRQNKQRNSYSRPSGGRQSGEFQFFQEGYTEGRRRSSMLSVLTDVSPSGQQMSMYAPPPYYTDPHTGMPVPANAFGMPTAPAMGYPPMACPGMMPPPMMPGYPGMAPMPWPGAPVPPMSYQPPPGYPPTGGVPGMPMPPPGMITDTSGKGAGNGGHTRTTVMLRKLPPEYTRDMVVDLLNKEGFERLYDFVYMPMNLRTMASFGYVFVNLTSPIVADQCRSVFQGFSRWVTRSDKVCDVLWSDEQQGLSANIERYRNSPVMHESVPQECKPIVLANGVRVPFPSPTKRLREPRIRRPQANRATAEEYTIGKDDAKTSDADYPALGGDRS